MWESGRTSDTGVLIDQNGQPIAGEFWWKDDCSGRVNSPGNNPHQPHYQIVSSQDQVQIFQELVTTPPPNAPEQCGRHADPAGVLTTSFLSICGTLKDNRLLPQGFLPLDQRDPRSVMRLAPMTTWRRIAERSGTGDDPAYKTGGGDTFSYHVKLSELPAPAAHVTATLYYQAIPPFYLQDRFCTAKGTDVDRLRFVTSQLKLDSTRAAQWKLDVWSALARLTAAIGWLDYRHWTSQRAFDMLRHDRTWEQSRWKSAIWASPACESRPLAWAATISAVASVSRRRVPSSTRRSISASPCSTPPIPTAIRAAPKSRWVRCSATGARTSFWPPSSAIRWMRSA